MAEPGDRLAARMDALRPGVAPEAPGWDDAREARVWRQVEARRRSPRRVLLAAAAALLLAVGTFTLGRVSAPAPRAARPAPEAPPGAVVRFVDGSTATGLDATSELQVFAAGPERTRLALVRGAARFEVVPQHQPFRVEAGDVAVEVLGTAFEMRHVGDARVAVAVDHGRVRVAWATGERVLEDGQEGLFPPPIPAPEPAREASPAPEAVAMDVAQVEAAAVEAPPPAPRRSAAPRGHAAPARDRSAARPLVPTDWRELAGAGRMQDAFEALQQQRDTVRDEVADLMEASDVARLSGHPREAIPPLRQVLSNHGGDPRAAGAAFTLGRLYLERLRQPARAAEAFARARALRPGGPLAVDAMAREIEARGRAGEGAAAAALAERFLAAHPTHPRAASVRAWTEAVE